MKSASGVGNVADSSNLPIESPLKSSVGVGLMISEEELMCEVVQSRKTKKKSTDGNGSILATSKNGLTNEVGLSEMHEAIGQRSTASHYKVPLFWGNSMGV